jgi:prepilin-type processing-associated H-X9-DG protein
MEPERKVEKWLQAFAKKRRDQAPGASGFELHPATRRLLQGEVRRQFGPPERKPASFGQRFRRISIRPMEVLVVVAIIALLAGLLLPALTRAKMKSQSIAAMSNLKQIGLAALLYAGDNDNRLPLSYGAMTGYLHGDAATIDPVSGERFIYVGGGQVLTNLVPAETVLAYSPTDKKSRAVLFADGHVELAIGKRFVELTNRGLLQLARADVLAHRSRLAEMPATAPPAAAPAAPASPAATATAAGRPLELAAKEELAKGADLGVELALADDAKNRPPAAPGKASQMEKPFGVWRADIPDQVQPTNVRSWGSGISLHFVRTDAASGVEYDNLQKDESRKKAPVLASFQVQQSGGEIRVLDADGSVYLGYMQPEVATGVTISGTNESQSPRPAAQLYSFRVAGTNLTLKQSVMFAGGFRAQDAAFSAAAMGATQGTSAPATGNLRGSGGGGAGSDSLTPSWPQPNVRITGTAVIGGTNQIEINAVPAAP